MWFAIFLDAFQFFMTLFGVAVVFLLILNGKASKKSATAAVGTIVIFFLYCLLYVPRMVILFQQSRRLFTKESERKVRILRLFTGAVVILG